MQQIQWAWAKAALLFIGLIFKGLAMSTEPLPFWWGVEAQCVAVIVWPAFDGAFLWLLQPPTEKHGKEGRGSGRSDIREP